MKISTSFRYDTRNRAILPDDGVLSQIRTEVSVPSFGESLQFYKIDLIGQWFQGLYKKLILSLRSEIGFGGGYGNSDDLPFFENFYAGGPSSVRGYRANTLGPRDTRGRPIGGELKFVGNMELIFPPPFLKKLDSVRLSSFLDAGSVYENLSSFELSDLRYSVGLGVVWISPFGQVSASIAQPISSMAEDDTQRFQFNFGTAF